MSKHGRRTIRGIGFLAIASFLIITLTPAANVLGRRIAAAPEIGPAEAIVVLGAGIRHDGSLSDPSLRRFVRGMELHKQELAPILVLSGRGRPDNPEATEAEVRAKLAELAGIKRDAILKEETANTTREESIRIFDLLKQRKARRILLVTESLHLRRAKLVFERAGFEVIAAPSDDPVEASTSPDARLDLFSRVAQETVALIYYRLAGYL